MGPSLRSTALVALHYQNDILHPDGKIRLGFGQDATNRTGVIDAARRLLGGARALGLPIVHVRTARSAIAGTFRENAPIFRNVVALGAVIEGEWGSEFFEELAPLPNETVVVHNRVNGFYESSLEMRLREIGADRLIMSGVATNSCVEHTARHAADIGYDVIVAEDACSASRRDVHEAALFNIGLIGSVTTVSDLVLAKFQ
ncbi:cysteine hydrolase family protein [Bradyrhizobium sp. CCBAU 53338]|uniref:cysteine hydrolase family protein n=1 Tax=Bradyrhizobium sp. CCBAU 53338 TaxID=1325111 RepID=UPI00188C5314|nr:isochorismatase family cysteine hydrolase [Bradyrhizobium sp. CCBAU 53338]QOZ52539.1 cysteine hydrolase [Bradyrhizobium sp. CCBAU 53338]